MRTSINSLKFSLLLTISATEATTLLVYLSESTRRSQVSDRCMTFLNVIYLNITIQ